MFRAVPLPIIRSLFTVHSSLYVTTSLKTAFEQDQDGTEVPSWSCSKAVYKPVWHIPLSSVQWINSWWWTDELSEKCRISWQNKFVKLVRLVGFITKKFVTMHGHMNGNFIHLVHIRALVSLYQINTDKCTLILFNHHFINTIPCSTMFQPLKANWYVLAARANNMNHQL